MEYCDWHNVLCITESACILPWHIWLTNAVDDGCAFGSNDQQLHKLQPFWTTLSARSRGRKHITYIFLCCLIWWRDLPKVAIGNGPQITTALETMKKVFPIYSYSCLSLSSTLVFLLQFFRKSISSCVLLFFHLHKLPPPLHGTSIRIFIVVRGSSLIVSILKPLKSPANCNAHQSSVAKKLNLSNSFLHIIDCLELFIERHQAVAAVASCFVCRYWHCCASVLN